MTRPLLRVSSGIAALLITTAAFAEVTADQVWQNWRDVSASYGQTLTAASEARQGDTLVISGLSIASAFEGGSVSGVIETVNFREIGDGTVEITMSPEYPLAVSSTDPDGKVNTFNVTIRQPDLAIIAAGTDTETRYDFTAPSVKVAVSDLVSDGKARDLALDVDMTVLGGNYIVTRGETTTLASNVTADSAGITLAMTDPDAGAKFNLKGNVSTLAGTSTGTLLDMAAMANMSAALKAGFATDGSFTYGTGAFEFDTTDATQTAKGNATTGGGNINFAMNADRLNYGGGAKDVNLTVASSAMPFPELTTSYAEAAFNMVMPVSKTEEPGDFSLLTRLVDFKINDEVWAMFDPGAVLPRDPATIILDAKGKARWLVDIMDPAQAEAVAPGAPPAELHALDLTEVKVSAAGAEVTGKGAFTFDNTDLTTFQGMPAPTGVLDLKIIGANGLLDNLIKLGFVPEDQAMGARMMMGLFAKPGEGEDTLTSTLEFKDKGFYANGQRLQ